METELADHERHSEVGLLVQEDFVRDVVKVELDSEFLSVRRVDDPETEVDSASSDKVRLSEATAEVSEVLYLVLKFHLLVLSVSVNHTGQHNVQVVCGQREVQRMGQLSLVVPAIAVMHIEVRLEERVKGLHADEGLHSVEVSVVFKGHLGEADGVVIADSFVEEEALDSHGEAVYRHSGGSGGDNVHLPEGVEEVEATVCSLNGLVDSGGQGDVNSFLVASLNQFDHRSLEEADEAASELRPDVSVQVYLDILLADHELHVHSVDSGEGPTVKQLLSGEADTYLELEALQVHIGVALGLHEALLELEVAAVESGCEVIGLENDSVVADIVVEIDNFVCLGKVEGVLD